LVVSRAFKRCSLEGIGMGAAGTLVPDAVLMGAFTFLLGDPLLLLLLLLSGLLAGIFAGELMANFCRQCDDVVLDQYVDCMYKQTQASTRTQQLQSFLQLRFLEIEVGLTNRQRSFDFLEFRKHQIDDM
jgi:hypothetical protein